MEEKDEVDKNENSNKIEKDKDENNINYQSSDISSFFIEELQKQEFEKNIKPNLLSTKTFNYSSRKFDEINPLRDVNKKINLRTESYEEMKENAIIESVVNLKIQYILFNIRDFVRKYQIDNNPNINSKLHKILRFIRNINLLIYGIIMFFERPWFCYDKATLPLPHYFKFSRDCDKVSFSGLPFINNTALRLIEITITLTIFIIQIIKYKNEYFLKASNIGVSKIYNIVQILSFISLLLCIIDLLIALFTGKFPIINFVLRAFIYIYMIRRIRRNWVNIGKILWRTKLIFFSLFMNIFFFSAIGYFLFKQEKGYFHSFYQSILQLYILLSTCNFPDIMIDTFDVSKLCIFFFIIYISLNYFIILSYLKILYYTKYYIVNKEICLKIITDIIDNEYNKNIFRVTQFQEFILKQKNSYLLNDEEYNNILILLDLYDKNNDLFNDLAKIIEKPPEFEMKTQTLYGKYILQSKIYEIIINSICILTLCISKYDDITLLSIQFVWSFILLFELYILIKNLGLKRFFFHHFNRVIFHIFNLTVLGTIIYIIVLDEMDQYNSSKYKKILKIYKIFLSLRTIRIFVFLDKFVVIKNIYTILRNSKEMFYKNIFTLYSLFLFFSTFSILLTGGNIEKNCFNDEKVEDIPERYEYVNFNDFISSFIACFSLLMINNLNILVKSLTYHINSNRIIFQFYFATFYFFSTLILINIIQTLLLELYLNSKNSLIKNKQILNKKGNIENNNQIIEENIKEEEQSDISEK